MGPLLLAAADNTAHSLAAVAQRRPGKAGSLYRELESVDPTVTSAHSDEQLFAMADHPFVWRIYGILHSIRWPSLAKTGRDGGIDKEQPDAKTRTSRRFHSFRSPVCRSTAVEVCLLWGTCHADMRPMFPHLCVCVVASSLMTTG